MNPIMNLLTSVPGSPRSRRMRLGCRPYWAALIALLLLMFTPGSAAAFSVKSDGTVTDSSTGLIWMRCSVGQTVSGSTCSGTATPYFWPYATALTGAVTFAGHTDWRLPSVRELLTIVDRSKFNPSIDSAAFPSTPNLPFWSATDYAGVPTAAWYVHFGDANVGSAFKVSASTAQVRLVRGGQTLGLLNPARPNSDYAASTDGTVTHLPSGLMWKRCAEGENWTGTSCSGSASSMTWSAASAATSTFAGQSDWRLPNAGELLSLVDYTRYSPAYIAVMFPAIPVTWNFWSSTAHAGDSTYAWYVGFGDGYAGYVRKAANNTALRLRPPARRRPAPRLRQHPSPPRLHRPRPPAPRWAARRARRKAPRRLNPWSRPADSSRLPSGLTEP